jgi:hypothetical protein
MKKTQPKPIPWMSKEQTEQFIKKLKEESQKTQRESVSAPPILVRPQAPSLPQFKRSGPPSLNLGL